MSCRPSSRPRRVDAAGCGEAKRRLDERRAEEAGPLPRSRPDRLCEGKRRLEEEHRAERRANAAYRGRWR